MDFNKVFLGGRLTRDVSLKTTQGGMAIAEFSLAVNRTFKKGDEKQKEVCFVDVVAFGKTAEVIAQYFAKGKPIFLEGRLRQESWEDKQSGAKRSKLGLVVESFQFVESRGAEQGGSESAAPAKSNQAPAAPKDVDTDIPF